jgi:hypothetical protein
MSKGDYELCLTLIGDPQARFESCRRSWEMQRESQQRMDEMKKKFAMPQPHLPSVAFAPPDMGQMATNHFVGDVRKLIEILVGAGRKTDAGKIRDQAVAILDDARLKSAVSDAEGKVQKRNAAQSSRAAMGDAAQTVADVRPVVVSTQPVSGTRDVEPGVVEIRARFSKEMADGS